jgi:two-component system, LuxR family, response regulator FixJ
MVGSIHGGISPADHEERSPLICVVDDDVSLLRALRRFLGTAGFAVQAFSSAEAFLQSEFRSRADCLVLDIRMDGMSGVELQEYLVAAGSAIPVVFMTAHEDVWLRERASRAGAVGYLKKPFGVDLLMDAINQAIGRA